MKAFFTAIYSKFSTGTNDFKTATGGRLEYGRAPANWTDNFAVVQGISIDSEDVFRQSINDISFQVTVFSTTRDGCFDLNDKCLALFDGAILTVTGKTAIRVNREQQTPPIWNEQDRLYQATTIFSCWVY